MLRLSFLGAFHVTLRGHPSPQFHTNKVRALLAYLALEAGQMHERATLVGLFWPEMPEAKALNNLSKALGLLRRALHEDAQVTPYLLTSRQSVRFNPEIEFWLDVAAFQDGVSPRAAASQLEEAVALYHGEFLSGFNLADASAFEEWLLFWRERLHQQMLAALDRLSAHYLAAREHEQAQRYARRQLELDAWRESAHVQLMQALALAGNRSAALAQYESCRRLLAEELGVEPAAETTALYELIKAGELAPEPGVDQTGVVQRPVDHNLPSPPTAFIGRQQELAALDDAIHKERARLVTIVGPGGIGKTRFALAYAERYLIAPQATSFADGVYFVPLLNLNPSSATPGAGQLVLAIMAAMKLPLETRAGAVVRPPKQQLLDYLRRKQLVLLLDNFDDLLAPHIGMRSDAEALVAEILQVAPQVQMIVTCRQPLGLYGERVCTLPGLALPNEKEDRPGSEDAMVHSEAMQLFIRSARRVQHDFQLRAGDWLPLARLCHFLGGMPLAIEVAASWVDALSIVDILIEMQRDLDFLRTNVLNVERRHHSMRKILNYTWQRLPPGEQSVLATLSVFRGGFIRQAAQALAMRAPAPPASPATEAGKFLSLRLLRNLVYKSLLHYNATRDRYEIHELLRRFAADKLAQDAAYEMAVRQGHSAYYCAALQAREAKLKGPQQQVALAEIEADIENVRVAWRWAAEQVDVPQVAATLEALFHFYDMRSWFQEGEQHFREAALCLAAAPAGRERAITMARLKARAGWFAFHLGQQNESIRLLQESLSQLQQQGAESESIFNLNYLGAVMRHLGECDQADTFLLEALRLARKYEDPYQASITLNILGQTSSLRGEYEAARHYCREGLRLKREIGEQRGMTYSLTYLGRVARALGDYQEAQRLFEESMAISEGLGDQRGVAFALQNLGGTAQALGRYDEAEKLYQRGLAIFRHIGNPLGTGICLIHLGEVTTVQGDLAAARRHLQEGVQIALATGSTPHLLAGLLAIAGFWLKSGHPERGIACLAFVQNDSNSTPALRERAQELEREGAETISSAPAGGLDTSPANDNIEAFVKRWIVMLA